MKDLSAKARSFFDERVRYHFEDAAKRTVLTYFGEEPAVFETKITKEFHAKFDLAAEVAFHSHEVDASMVIAMRSPFALLLYERMTGEALTAMDNNVEDCMGELANIVYGLAKAPLVNEGFEFPMARPKTTQDPSTFLKEKKCLSVTFRIDGDAEKEFAIVLVIHRVSEKIAGKAA